MLSLSLINNKSDQKQQQQENLFKIAENFVKTASSIESATDQETKTKAKLQMNSTASSTSASSFRIDDILVKNAEASQEKKPDDSNSAQSQAALSYSNNLMSTLSSFYDMSCYLPPSMSPLLNKSNHPSNQQFMPLIYNSNKPKI